MDSGSSLFFLLVSGSICRSYVAPGSGAYMYIHFGVVSWAQNLIKEGALLTLPDRLEMGEPLVLLGVAVLEVPSATTQLLRSEENGNSAGKQPLEGSWQRFSMYAWSRRPSLTMLMSRGFNTYLLPLLQSPSLPKGHNEEINEQRFPWDLPLYLTIWCNKVLSGITECIRCLPAASISWQSTVTVRGGLMEKRAGLLHVWCWSLSG